MVLSQVEVTRGVHTVVDAISPVAEHAVPAALHAGRNARRAAWPLGPKAPQLSGLSSLHAREVPTGVPQPLLALQVGS